MVGVAGIAQHCRRFVVAGGALLQVVWVTVDAALQKTTFSRRQPLVEDEDDLLWKTTFGGRQPLLEDDFWEMTFSRRRALFGGTVCK